MLEELRHAVTRPWTVMEVCGGQTHAIASLGLEELLPPGLRLIHGPGCPVCVTSVDLIDQAVELSLRPGVVLCSYGDMMRVPGSSGDLFSAKARGGDVLLMYSPLEAVAFAGSHPEAEVVFFAVGFETTAPATALAMQQARALGYANFSVLCAHVQVPPALEWLMDQDEGRPDAFLAPGHVCAIMGEGDYGRLAARYRTPMAVTGFEAPDLLRGILMCVRQLKEHPDSEYIFLQDNGKLYTDSMLKYHVNIMIYENDIRDDKGNYFEFRTHRFRHTFGVKLTEMKLDDDSIARLLGHKDTRTIPHYRRLRNEALAEDTKAVRDEMNELLAQYRREKENAETR